MSGKRLLGTVVLLVLFAGSGWAQVNEFSVTAGRTFVSTQTAYDTGLSFNPPLHFGNDVTIAFNYGRLLKTYKIIGIKAELPVAIYPRMDLRNASYKIPKDFGALFATPSLRVHFFSGDSLTPWASVGGGYGRFRYSPDLIYTGYGPNPGPGGSNTGVVQFGAGLDSWVWHKWGFRFEARDFYSGEPDLNVTTNRSRVHNYYVGFGIVTRF